MHLKLLDKACVWRGSKLDKKSAVAKSHGFAHSILWICMGLSTEQGGLAFAGVIDAGNPARIVAGPESRNFFLAARCFGSIGSFTSVSGRSRKYSRASAWPKPKIFFRRSGDSKTDPQVYTQKRVYRIVVIVNGGAHLWISRVLSTRSNVYGPHKPVGLPCMCLVEKMDKKSCCAKTGRFAQSVPVDMQTLIHSPETLPIW